MSDDRPSDFISMSDYMGLNAEDVRMMEERMMAEGNKLRDTAMGDSAAHYSAAEKAGLGEDGGQAAYEQAGEQARVGMASYSEFMGGMSDPAKRQALMEKVYGKGAASWMDSAMMGGSANRFDDSARKTQHEFDANEAGAANRLGQYQQIGAERERQRKKSEMDRIDKENLVKRQAAQKAEDEENARIDAYGAAAADKEGGPYDAHGTTWSGKVDWGGIFGSPSKDPSYGNINQREWARQKLYAREAAKTPGGKVRKWQPGDSVYGDWLGN